MQDLDYLKKLQEAMAGEEPVRDEYVTDPNIRDEYVSAPEQEIEQVNEQAKSPYMQEKEDIKPEDVLDMSKMSRDIASIAEDNLPKQDKPKEMDAKAEYAKLIKEYKDKLNKPQKDTSGLETAAALANVLNQAARVEAAGRGATFLGMDPSSAVQSVKSSQQKKRQQDLSGLQNLQAMYKNYIDMNKKDADKMKNIYKVGDELVKVTPEGKAQKLYGEKKKEEKEISKGQEAADKAFAKDYSDFAAQGGIASLNKNIDKLKEVQALLTKENGPNLTGAGLGMLPDAVKNIFAEQSIAARDSVESVIQQSLRQILGAQFTEKEAERLIQRSYNENLSEEENAKRLKETISELEAMGKAKEKAARYFEKKGTLEGFKADLPGINKIKVQLPDGRKGTVKADKLEDFKKKYPDAIILE